MAATVVLVAKLPGLEDARPYEVAGVEAVVRRVFGTTNTIFNIHRFSFITRKGHISAETSDGWC